MTKQRIILGVTLLLIIGMLSGCTQPKNGGPKTVTMTAQELMSDFKIDTDWKTSFSMLYNSLDDNDTLIIQDNITNIHYDPLENATKVTFSITQGSGTGEYSPWFEGNITGSYAIGDQVKITGCIKHVTFSNATLHIDLELYEEQWESVDYFFTYVSSELNGFKPMPQHAITLVHETSSGGVKTLYVASDGSQEYTSIQDAIDASSTGDTVFVYNGIYYEHVILNKAIILLGEDPASTIIDGNDSGNVVNITTNSARLANFTIQQSGDRFFDAGVYITAESVVVSNNQIINNYEGISAHGLAYGTILSNVIANNSHDGIYLSYWSEHNEISCNNVLANGWNGLEIWAGSDNNIITRNEFTENGVCGVAVSSGEGNRFSSNNFIGNQENANESDYSTSGQGANFWDNGISTGNYWDDYTGVDSNHDGIGDTAYTVPGRQPPNQDPYPVMTRLVLPEVPPLVKAVPNE